MSKKSKQDKPLVKVPRGRIRRAAFAGSQVAGAIAAVRAIRDARAKNDKLALVYGTLNAAILVVTVLIAVRTVRADDAEKAESDENTDAAPVDSPVFAAADR